MPGGRITRSVKRHVLLPDRRYVGRWFAAGFLHQVYGKVHVRHDCGSAGVDNALVAQRLAGLQHQHIDERCREETVERATRQSPASGEPRVMADHLGDREFQLVQHAVNRNPGRLDQAARELGVSRTTLWRRMRKYGIKAN